MTAPIPGPYDMHPDTAIRGGRGQDVFAIEAPSAPICTIDAPPEWSSEYAAVKATAVLFTAAPDLLAACEAVAAELIPFYPNRALFNKWRDSIGDELSTAYAAIWDGITKAKGGAS